LAGRAREHVRDMRVKADPRDIEEQVTVQCAGIDRATAVTKRHRHRRLSPGGNPEFAREAIAGPGWDDTERHVGLDEGRGD
jgi:hypothetical protein